MIIQLLQIFSFIGYQKPATPFYLSPLENQGPKSIKQDLINSIHKIATREY